MSHPILKVTGTADLRAEELSAGLEAKTHRLGRGCPRDKPQDPAHLALKMRRWPLPGHHTRRARPQERGVCLAASALAQDALAHHTATEQQFAQRGPHALWLVKPKQGTRESF